MRSMWTGAALALTLVVGATPALAQDAPAQPDPGAGSERYHEDDRALLLEDALLQATLAAVRDDVEGLAVAFRKIESLLPAALDSGDDRYGPEIPAIDRAYRLAIGTAIEQADAGDDEAAIKSQYWMLVGCRRCHIQARKNDLLPHDGPLRPGN